MSDVHLHPLISTPGLERAMQYGRDVEPRSFCEDPERPGLSIATRPPGWNRRIVRVVDRAREIAERNRDPVESLTLSQIGMLRDFSAGERIVADKFGRERYVSSTGKAVCHGSMLKIPSRYDAERLRELGYLTMGSFAPGWAYDLTRAGRDALYRIDSKA